MLFIIGKVLYLTLDVMTNYERKKNQNCVIIEYVSKACG